MTLKDIAALAGVSTATVSYVLNNRENKVSPEVAARVRSIVEEVGYRPNPLAKSLRSSKSGILGVMTEDLSVWQVGSVMQGVMDEAESRGYSVVVSNLGMKKRIQSRYDEIYQYQDLVDEAVRHLKRLRVGGIIFIAMHDRSVTDLIMTELPVVYAYCSTERSEDIQVSYNNFDISKTVAKLLLSRYEKRVGIIAGPKHSAASRERLMGVRQACTELQIQLPENHIRYGDWEYESGLRVCRSILESEAGLRAVYAMNDQMALGAMHVLQEKGLRIPEDVCVIGFDDMMVCPYANPPLSSIHVPLEDIGKKAADALLSVMDGEEPQEKRLCLSCTLTERESFRLKQSERPQNA